MRTHFETHEVPSIQSDAMVSFFAWEKLRVLYSGLLAMPVLLFWFSNSSRLPSSFWFQVATGAVVANIGFCVGPVAENYLRWAGCNRDTSRWTLFVLGLFIGMFLTILFLISFVMGHGI